MLFKGEMGCGIAKPPPLTPRYPRNGIAKLGRGADDATGGCKTDGLTLMILVVMDGEDDYAIPGRIALGQFLQHRMGWVGLFCLQAPCETLHNWLRVFTKFLKLEGL